MQVTINPLSDVKQEADIELTPEELQPHFDKAYEKYRPKVEIRGFRKGKAPLAMIKRLYGEAIEQDALESIAGEFFQKAMEEKDIHPIGQPAIVDMDFKRGERFHFRIAYEVKPDVALKTYTGIRVEKPVHRVTDADVDAEVEHLRRANSTTTEATQVTDTEHLVTTDVQELDDTGTPLIGKKQTGVRFLLSDTTIAPEIREALSHAETGGTYRASFESRHGDHTHTVHAAMTVTKIEKVNLPPFDDELVKKVSGGKAASKEEFLAGMRKDLERYWEEQASKKVADDIANEIVREHDVPVPDTLVEGFLEAFLDDIKNRTRDRKLPAGFNEQKFREENRASAVWQAKWMLLKERIAEQEHLAVTDEEVEQLAADDASKLGIDKERMLQYYRSSSGPRDRLLTDKIMAFLTGHAKITEKVVEAPAA